MEELAKIEHNEGAADDIGSVRLTALVEFESTYQVHREWRKEDKDDPCRCESEDLKDIASISPKETPSRPCHWFHCNFALARFSLRFLLRHFRSFPAKLL